MDWLSFCRGRAFAHPAHERKGKREIAFNGKGRGGKKKASLAFKGCDPVGPTEKGKEKGGVFLCL